MKGKAPLYRPLCPGLPGIPGKALSIQPILLPLIPAYKPHNTAQLNDLLGALYKTLPL